YDGSFPVVIKQASGSAGNGVYLSYNLKDYKRLVKKAGRIIIASGLNDLAVTRVKNMIKNLIKVIYPSRAGFVQYNTAPVSNPVVVQNFIPGLAGDYKVLFFGGRFYCMYRK